MCNLKILEMNRLFFLIIGLVLANFAFSQADITAPMTEAIKTGNASKIGSYFAPNVDLTLPGTEEVLPADQAKKLLERFFSQHPAKSFAVKHRGTSKMNDHYRIGDLSTSKGNFRVTFFMKSESGKFSVTQFRIEPADDDF